MPIKRILILGTGGGLMAGAETHQPQNPMALSLADINKALPEVSSQLSLNYLEIFREDSENFTHRDWLKIASTIDTHYQHYEGFVIMHGTESLAYTAAALTFMLHKSHKPVVMVTSTISIRRTDLTIGRTELKRAIMVAAHDAVSGVVVVSNGTIIPGTRARKFEDQYGIHHASNQTDLGTVDDKTVMLHAPLPKPIEPFRLMATLNPNLAVIFVHPDYNPRLLFHILLADKPDAFLFIGYGTGCVPVLGQGTFIPFIKELNAQGIPSFACSRSIEPRTNLERFGVGNRLLSYGVIPARDMTHECATAKLMWILGQTKIKDEVIERFRHNYAGEITS